MNTSPTSILHRLLHRVRTRLREDTEHHIALVLAGHAVRLVLGLASSAVLARGLGPAGLSTFSVLSATMMIAITLGDLGLSSSAVRHVAADLAADPVKSRSTAQVFTILKLLGSLIVVIGGLILAEPIAALLTLPSGMGPGLVRLAGLGVLATAGSGVISTILQALRRFPYLIATQTLNTVLTVALIGALYLAERLTIANALVVGAVTALAGALLGWGLLPAGWRSALRSRAPLSGQAARRLWRFGRWLWLSTILVIIISQLDLLLLNRWAAPQVTGHYALALNLALKAEVLNQTLHTVLLPNVSGLSGREEFAAYVRRSLLRSGLLAGMLLLTLPLARPFILTVYGVEYGPSVPLFYLLIGVTVFDVILNPLLLLAYPLDMPRHIAASHGVRVVVMLLAGSMLVPGWGGAGAALAKLAAKTVGALFLGIFLAARLLRTDN